MLLSSQAFWVVAASQVATAAAGSAILPTLAGITSGICGQAGFGGQNARNQAINHGGKLAGAALSGSLGWKFGLPAIF